MNPLTALTAVAATAFLLVGCSQPGPSDTTIRECILDVTDHQAVGVERPNVVMGMEIGTTVIDAIDIENVIEEGNNTWLVYSRLTVGSRDMHSSEQDSKATAQMFGFEYRDGYLLQDVEVNYLFNEGRQGWSCREL
ncbi:MAG: hypothetical protein XD36_3036 [Halomonas sp. 54_146]|nr:MULTISPECIES: hypothetical protein [unclassified Halomonas]KUJ86539.1 MAG: hypothetical protein XD36_3036 [Halomonas sp. 54_146]HAA44781.1 hypothetical protein [Halomonas sp.]